MRLPAGSTLGPYQITGPIGAGGMGEVYRARDTRLGREVAIKILPREVAADPERLARFEREARSSSALNHPNIVTIHDFTLRDGETWLVMELIRGESLRDLIGRGPVPLKKLLTIAAGIADGLAAAHAAGIVHRDLKPENVMLTSDGVAKILDFGLVKHAAPADLTDSPTEHQVSRAGVTLGTATYMSPEQARGGPIDFRSDQFSQGLILYEMATGKHPFRRSTTFETLTAMANDEMPPLGDSFPEPLVWIVERCLAKNPAERYGSTADLARDLARLRDRPSGAGMRPLPAVPVKRNWWILAALAAVIIVILTMLMLTARRTPARISDPIQVDIATPQVAGVSLGEVSLPVAISPDGRHLVVNGVDANGNSELWLHDLHSGTARLIVENGFAPAWSSDGKGIAFFAEGKLKTVTVEGGPARIVCDARPEGTPTWHGDTILFGQYSLDPGLYRVSASGGVPTLLIPPTLKPRRSLPFWPQFLPDGKHFLYLGMHPGSGTTEITRELRVASLDGGPPRIVPGINSRALFAEERLVFVREGTLMAQPFDPDQARLSGEAEPIVDEVHYFKNTGLAGFSVSQNGILAWRSARPPSRLVWLDRGGMEIQSIGTATFDASGRLSEDGKRYVVGVIDPKQGVSDIWVYELERGSAERMTFLFMDEKSPVWARDGRTIYYRSDGQGPPDIVQIRPGEERGSILYRGPSVEEPKDVSPDGKWLLFVSSFISGADIQVLPLDPVGPPRPFAATPFNENSPRFSPDGRWVAYASDLSGRPEIYVRPFEGTAPASRISKDGGTRPRWRRDGRELYYLGPDGRIMAVPFDGSFSTPRLLFQSANAADFEPAPDGSRFLVQLQERSADPPVHLLINWPARLRTREKP